MADKKKEFGVEYMHLGLNKWLESGKSFSTEKQAEKHRDVLSKHGSRELTRIKKNW